MKDPLIFMPLLRRPQCRVGTFSNESDQQELYGAHYPVVYCRPVLLRHDNAVFLRETYQLSILPVPDVFRRNWTCFIPDISVNLASEQVLARVRQLLAELPLVTVLVVGSGRQRHWLYERLGADDTVRVVYTDIDVGADVDLLCDGHDLPFVYGAFDAVVTTAVLEHVLYPERVTAENHRVLKIGGLLYSERPFIQQVHEGAYDFTRYVGAKHLRHT